MPRLRGGGGGNTGGGGTIIPGAWTRRPPPNEPHGTLPPNTRRTVEPVVKCWGIRPRYKGDGKSPDHPKEPGTTIEWPDYGCPEGTPSGGGFKPIGFKPSSFLPLSYRSGECENEEKMETWTEIARQYRVVRVKNPEDEDQYVDVEEALTSIFQTPAGNRRLVWAQQPPPDETISEGFRGTNATGAGGTGAS